MAKKYKIRLIAAVVLLGLSFVLIQLAKSFPHVTEQIYSRGFFPVLSRFMIAITAWLPFSLAELLLVALVVIIIAGLAIWIIQLRKTKTAKGRKQRAFSLISGIALAATTLCFLFVMVGGLNYHRLSFTYYSGLEVIPSTVDELAGLCENLAERANHLRTQVDAGPDAVMRLSQGFYETAELSRKAYSVLSKQYIGILDNGAFAKPKPVLLSVLMSYSRITGGYFFYTFEPNINTHIPDYQIPSTMTHELAHSCGFMREDEANYLAYLACTASDSADLQYSGVMLALIHSLNALYSADQERYAQVNDKIAPAVWWDMQASNRYWADFETRYGEFSDKVNDTYLRVNSQTDGVKSYGRMVDLLLAEYRKNNPL